MFERLATLSPALSLQLDPKEKPLSERPLGYFLAILGGTAGLPIGWIASPLVLLALNKFSKGEDGKPPNRFARWALIGIVGAPACLAPLIALGNYATDRDIEACNKGEQASCARLLTIESAHSRVTNPYLTQLKESARISREKAREEEKERIRQEVEHSEAMSQKREADRKAAEIAENKEREKREFSTWASSSAPLVGCKVELKKQLRDPGSYQDDWAQPSPIVDSSKQTVSFVWPFRSKNGFGGYTNAAAACESRPDKSAPSPAWGGYGIPVVRVIESQ